jgi:hypothetical protein
LPFGFFWLKGQDPCRFVALKTRVFAERGIERVNEGLLISQLLVML